MRNIIALTYFVIRILIFASFGVPADSKVA